MIVESHIALCPRCNGVGTTMIRAGAYESEPRECSYCDGTGRIKESIIHDKLTPNKKKS
jgi:DnaJ-class molecular chaperone